MKSAIYAVTNYRALIFGEQILGTHGVFLNIFHICAWTLEGSFRSFYKNDLMKITCRERKDGRGDVCFAGTTFVPSRDSFDIFDPPTTFGFFNITSPREVVECLRRIEDFAPLIESEDSTS